MSLSADGQVIAIGAWKEDDNGIDSGQTRIYRWTGTTWNQLGNDINGEAAGDNSGVSVALSADGRTVIIGARANNDNGEHSGQARIYRWTGEEWNQLGNDINGEAAWDLQRPRGHL